MAGYSRRRRMIGIVVAAVLAVAGAVLLIDRATAKPLTAEHARTALVRHLPELRDAPVTEHDGRIDIGDYCCDLSGKTWGGRVAHELLGKELPGGHFERRPFGRWRAVESAERFTLVCIYTKPTTE
jgi:hypothetical protein